MSTVAEIEAAIAKLSLEDQSAVSNWLNTRLVRETADVLAAIDEADLSLAEEGGLSIEEARRDIRRWITE